MSTPELFAIGVRLHLLETAPRLKTRFVKHREAFVSVLPLALRVEWLNTFRCAYVALYTPRDPRLGYAVTVELLGVGNAIVYASHGDIYPLCRWAANYLVNPPKPDLSKVAIWCTPAARRDCPHDDMNRHGVLLDDGLDGCPRVRDLFCDPDFWAFLRSASAAPKCHATCGAFADFVQERGFDCLANVLRTESKSALRLLPKSATCPTSNVAA